MNKFLRSQLLNETQIPSVPVIKEKENLRLKVNRKKKKLADSDHGSWYNQEKQWPDECPWIAESTESSSNTSSSKRKLEENSKTFEWDSSDKEFADTYDNSDWESDSENKNDGEDGFYFPRVTVQIMCFKAINDLYFAKIESTEKQNTESRSRYRIYLCIMSAFFSQIWPLKSRCALYNGTFCFHVR